jgi:hypothetical protein
MQVNLNVNCRLLLFDFNQNRKKIPNIKFHENPSGGRQDVSREQTDGRAEMTWLVIAFRNCFENAAN